MTMTESKLTARQAAFVAEYMIDLNAAAAARRAGYSARTAEAQASRLLANVKISAAIAEAQAARAKRTEITADRVLKEIGLIAFAPIGDKDVRSFDKHAALVTLGKHLGLFTENARLELSGGVTFNYAARAEECRTEIARRLERIAAAWTAAEEAEDRVVQFNRGGRAA